MRRLWNRLANYYHWGYRISPLCDNRKAIEMLRAPVRLYRGIGALDAIGRDWIPEQAKQYRNEVIATIMRQLLEQMARAEFVNRGARVRIEADIRLSERHGYEHQMFEVIAIVKNK